ncbi:MAG: hypothetical protein ACI9KE_000419 [Polyangiales bacterium]|jgi:hypothetical protein
MLWACGAEQASQEAPPPAGYSIHEWGLVHFALGESEGMATAGPGHFPPFSPSGMGQGTIGIGDTNSVAFKPVLYVHLDPGMTETTFSAGISATILEHWPDATALATGVRWQRVTARSTACTGLTYPSVDSERCNVEDGFCEVAELGLYETDDSACLSVGQAQANNLFYRAGLDTSGPLQVLFEDNVAQVRNVSAHAFPGVVIRVVRDPSGRNTRFYTIDPPAPGQSVSLTQREGAGSGAELMESIEAHLERTGLTAAERRAFVSAWTGELIGGDEVPALQNPRDNPPPLAPAEDALLYWLSAEHAQEILPLTFEPAPSIVRRALMARVHLPTSSSPHSSANVFPPPAPSGATIRIGRAQLVGEGMIAQVMRRVMRRHHVEMSDCVEQNAGELRAGRIILEAELRVDGTVASASARFVDEGPEALTSCIASAFEGWTFPASSDGAVTYRNSLGFTYLP